MFFLSFALKVILWEQTALKTNLTHKEAKKREKKKNREKNASSHLSLVGLI